MPLPTRPHLRANQPIAMIAPTACMSDFQIWLTQLGAPKQLIQWAQPYSDLASCWRACPAPDWLLWLSARLSRTREQRAAVVLCAAGLSRHAQRLLRNTDERIGLALGAAERWAKTGASSGELLLAADAALNAAWECTAQAASNAARARLLFRRAPRRRLASAQTGRALAAYQDWRAAD